MDNPVSIQEGMSAEEESQYLSQGIIFIRDLAIYLRLAKSSVGTAQIFFHRFAYSHSFVSFDRFLQAGICLFFAAKLLDQPRSLKDFCEAYYGLNSYKRQLKNPRFRIPPINLEDLKRRACCAEFELLSALSFDFSADLPYNSINDYRKTVSPQMVEQFTTIAYNFANDSFRSRVCLVKSGREIGDVCIYLACLYLEIPCQVQPDPVVLDQILKIYEQYI